MDNLLNLQVMDNLLNLLATKLKAAAGNMVRRRQGVKTSVTISKQATKSGLRQLQAIWSEDDKELGCQ